MNQDKQSFSKNKKLLFVYNADSSLFKRMGDLVHKAISPKTYQCSLCGLTYSGINMKSNWVDFINSLPIKAEFLHKDEFIIQYPNRQNVSFPVVFIKEKNSLTESISTKEIDQLNNLDELINLVREKASKI